MTTRSLHKDGSGLYVDMSFALVTDDSGHVLCAVAMARDITSRHRAERQSRELIAELEAQLKDVRRGD